ncbi:MAG TPA: histidine kinase [Terracidiphilus sp.]|nr:histidine kinase [Terracidiphilus sp.]
MPRTIAQPENTAAPGKPSRAYWACQLLGWGGYGLGYYLAVLVPFQSAGPRQIVADFAYCAAGVLGTHLLRARIKSRGWTELSYAAMAPRLVVGALLVGALQTLALDGCLTLYGLVNWKREIIVPVVSVTVISSAVLVLLWLAIYLTIHAIRRRRAAELDALRSQLIARDTSLRALQQQLNPHFLFNCLNSLRGMIDEDRARAQEMVTRLAELLRASLRQDECNAIPLAEELATVNAYLELESVRLEERLRIRREISPSTHSALVPPMLLQGLVENALKHGIANVPAGGDVVLRIARAEDQLRIEVENTGALQPSIRTGIGLANARERLRLLYGPSAELSLAESSPGRVRATVLMPFHAEEIQPQETQCGRSS